MTPPSFGDSFPQSLREAFCVRNIVPGTILKFLVDDTNPPKEKYFVVLAINETAVSVACLYINTEINLNIFTTETLRDLHLPLLKLNYEFLDHDSYLDCSDLREKSLEVIKQSLSDDVSALKGNITQIDLLAALQKTHSAVTIPQKLKRKFCL